MLNEPQAILLAAFSALSAGDAAALARLADPADEVALRDHVAALLDIETGLPSEDAFAKAPFPPEMARILRDQVAAGYRHTRRRTQRQFGVRDGAELSRLSFDELIAAAWQTASRPYFRGLQAKPVGTVVEGTLAFVLFRLVTDAMPEGRPSPDIATLVALQNTWRLRLDIRAPLLLPGTQGIFRVPPEDDHPPAAG